MNEELILEMVSKYLKNQTLTYNDFDQIFNILSRKEQYAVSEVLERNQIELVDQYEESSEEKDFFGVDEELVDHSKGDLFLEEVLPLDVESDSEDEVQPILSQPLIKRDKVLLSNRTLIRMIQEGSDQAKQDLCVKNQGLVDKYASVYQHLVGNKMEFEDLQQAGMIGMIKAAEKFDFNKGTEFSTYAVWWIKQAITREIMDNGYTVRIPVHMMERIFRVLRSDSRHIEETNYKKRLRLISNELEMPIEVVEECLKLYYQFINSTSLDLPVGEDEDVTIKDFVPAEDEKTIEDVIMLKALRENLDLVLKNLTPKEEAILRLRFGFDDGRIRTLEEIGEQYGLTRERIRQIESKALRKLRHPTRTIKLKDFLY